MIKKSLFLLLLFFSVFLYAQEVDLQNSISILKNRWQTGGHPE